MKFFASFFESAASKQTANPNGVSKSDNKRHDAAATQDAIAKAYRHCGPRVARHLARNIKKTSSLEDHTCGFHRNDVLH